MKYNIKPFVINILLVLLFAVETILFFNINENLILLISSIILLIISLGFSLFYSDSAPKRISHSMYIITLSVAAIIFGNLNTDFKISISFISVLSVLYFVTLILIKDLDKD